MRLPPLPEYVMVEVVQNRIRRVARFSNIKTALLLADKGWKAIKPDQLSDVVHAKPGTVALDADGNVIKVPALSLKTFAPYVPAVKGNVGGVVVSGPPELHGKPIQLDINGKPVTAKINEAVEFPVRFDEDGKPKLGIYQIRVTENPWHVEPDAVSIEFRESRNGN